MLWHTITQIKISRVSVSLITLKLVTINFLSCSASLSVFISELVSQADFRKLVERLGLQLWLLSIHINKWLFFRKPLASINLGNIFIKCLNSLAITCDPLGPFQLANKNKQPNISFFIYIKVNLALGVSSHLLSYCETGEIYSFFLITWQC